MPEACPIVGSYGGRESVRGVRETFDRLEPALEAAGIDHDIKLYPEAGHGFLNDRDPADLPLWVNAVAKLSAASYHEPSGLFAYVTIRTSRRTEKGIERRRDVPTARVHRHIGRA